MLLGLLILGLYGDNGKENGNYYLGLGYFCVTGLQLMNFN